MCGRRLRRWRRRQARRGLAEAGGQGCGLPVGDVKGALAVECSDGALGDIDPVPTESRVVGSLDSDGPVGGTGLLPVAASVPGGDRDGPDGGACGRRRWLVWVVVGILLIGALLASFRFDRWLGCVSVKRVILDLMEGTSCWAMIFRRCSAR